MSHEARTGPLTAAGNEGNAQALIDWFNDGADGQIDWGQPGDFEQCVAVAGKHVDDPEGFCNLRHQDAVGGPPGSEDKHASTTEASMGATISYGGAPYVGDGETYRLRPGSAFISQEERDKAAASGAALPDGSFPITACEGDNSVDTAIHAVGRAGSDHDAVRAHIIKRADSLGCASKIPDNWNDDGSLKAAVRASGAPIGENAPMTTSRDAVLSAFYADRGGLTAGAEAFTPPPPPPPAQGKAAPPTPPGDPATPNAPSDGGDGEGSPKDAQVDAGVSERIKALVSDVEALKQLQGTDPGTGKDPEDIRVDTALEAVEAAVQTLAKAQDADNAAAPAPPKAPPAPPKAPASPQPPAAPAEAAAGAETQAFATGQPGAPTGGVPGDADDSGPGPGDIEASAVCQNPECQHAGGVHEDTEDGANQGHCQTPGCNCPGMVPDADVISNPDDTGAPTDTDGSDAVGNPAPGTTGGPIGGGPTSRGHAADGTAFADAPPAPAEADKAPAERQAPEMTGGPEAALPPLDPEPNITVGPQFTIPVAWVEGAPTGDGRQIAVPGPDSPGLSWRTPPLALMGLKTSPHDPGGMSPNDPAVLIGRIEQIERDGNIGKATGHLLTTDDGMEFASILEQMGRMGVSIDVGSATVTVGIDPSGPAPEPGAMPFDQPMLEVLTEGQILGMTVCPFAAFEGAYIVLGDGSNVPDSKPPAPPAGAEHMAINIVQEEVCLPCMGEDGEQPIIASAAPGVSLLHPPRAWFADPGFKRGDPRLHETLDSKTGRPSGKFACPITVTDDGQVFGHIAQWGVCHQNPQFLAGGQCVMAPRSRMNYEAFHGTGDVITAEGDVLGVGRMTADTGHAPTTHGVSYAQAVAHYDNSGTTTALVRAGEDEFGIWVAGSLHPSATPEQVFTMRSNPPSGDWRPFGSGRELCNVLFVNTPGFPMVKMAKDASSGKVLSLVAAGVPLFEMPGDETHHSPIDSALAKALAPVFRITQDRLTQEMDALLA